MQLPLFATQGFTAVQFRPSEVGEKNPVLHVHNDVPFTAVQLAFASHGGHEPAMMITPYAIEEALLRKSRHHKYKDVKAAHQARFEAVGRGRRAVTQPEAFGINMLPGIFLLYNRSNRLYS